MDTERIHILVVDDVSDTAESMAEVLALWGYDATACNGGAVALMSVCTRRPAAVLLDLAMPGMNGFEFARALHQLPGCAAVPLIAISGYSPPAYVARAREAGIAHCVLKPADLDELRALLAVAAPRKAVPSGLGAGPWFARRGIGSHRRNAPTSTPPGVERAPPRRRPNGSEPGASRRPPDRSPESGGARGEPMGGSPPNAVAPSE